MEPELSHATGTHTLVLDEILAFNSDRKAKKVRLKLERMDENAFAFFRGTDHLFAREWPEFRPPDVGPSVLICGDLHLENFGAYQSDDGEFLYDINDFDEAIVAPCSLDLVRCTASILLAAELWRLTPLEASGMVLAFLEEYRASLSMTPRRLPVAGEASLLGHGAIAKLLGALASGDQVALLDHNTEVIKGGKRRLLRTEDKHPGIRKERARQIKDAVAAYGKTTPGPDAYKVLDVTARIAGIGSLGLRRYLVLVEGGGSPDENLLLDIKEVRPSCLRRCTDAPQPDTSGNEARRVVEAQRTLQAKPMLGLDVIEIKGEAFRMRQMVPEENRSSLDRFQKKPEKLRDAVQVAGRLTGWSHLRGISPADKLHGGEKLVRWAAGPALDSLVAAAARCAERTRLDYEQFHKALTRPGALPKPLRLSTKIEKPA